MYNRRIYKLLYKKRIIKGVHDKTDKYWMKKNLADKTFNRVFLNAQAS